MENVIVHNVYDVKINNVSYVVVGKDKSDALVNVNNYINKYISCNDNVAMVLGDESNLVQIDKMYRKRRMIIQDGIMD